MDDKYLKKLLISWESIFKKGQFSFWLLLSLKEGPKYTEEIKSFMEGITKGQVSAEEQSLYRSLRKFYDLEVVDFETREGNKGPDRKYYFLTKIGNELLENFTDRNIKLFYKKEVLDLINNK